MLAVLSEVRQLAMSDDQTGVPLVPTELDKDADSKASDAQERIRDLRARARMGGLGLAEITKVRITRRYARYAR